jgi:hypothetical protein
MGLQGVVQISIERARELFLVVQRNRIDRLPFTLIEMHLGQDNKGEGAMLTRSAISAKDGRLQLEHYGVEPIKLTEITPEK